MLSKNLLILLVTVGFFANLQASDPLGVQEDERWPCRPLKHGRDEEDDDNGPLNKKPPAAETYTEMPVARPNTPVDEGDQGHQVRRNAVDWSHDPKDWPAFFLCMQFPFVSQ